MLFSSITFLYYFLPIVFVLYFLAPKKIKNLVLFISSLVFYAWGEPKYVFLMILSVAIGYIAGLLMDKLESILGIKNGEITADRKFSLDATRCIGACGLAPVLTVNEEVYGRLTPDMIQGIIDKYNK